MRPYRFHLILILILILLFILIAFPPRRTAFKPIVH